MVKKQIAGTYKICLVSVLYQSEELTLFETILGMEIKSGLIVKKQMCQKKILLTAGTYEWTYNQGLEGVLLFYRTT